MPELPEVETVRRQLAENLVGRRLVRAEFSRMALRAAIPARQLARALQGATVLQIRRRAKYLLWDFSSGYTMLAHLGMSGHFFIGHEKVDPVRHTHGRWRFAGLTVHFVDPRRFGLLKLYKTAEVLESAELAELGPEPFDPIFTPDWLRQSLKQSAAPIKSWLLDQKRLSGLGNIYANEALFRSRIHPRRPSHTLRPREAQRLHTAIRQVLLAAIEHAGTTFLSYKAPDGGDGAFYDSLLVFQREGLECHRCGVPIERIVQSGRSSFFCPTCQKAAPRHPS
ncbi:MAG: bifunctional DNA-formamidopyrimidine glycosylase/DNA-(apurinic or apyrimidinic site) lyase [Acidobacteria bacterium]|nr:bifunctional DNA-formamidopyrimidine glycosylase/DNA-(apurinic or apyrimidinic site) lyase [Acidobacteriota bacterium]MBI3655504.1 bifunctional DNA-formamidopyrimidine glycosylase/DNA-(apurinic or apyrimidinic site) lyase [Acidobacteriota bacterium]